MLKKLSQQTIGDLAVIGGALLLATFPLISKTGVDTLPPILFGGLSFIVAGLFLLPFIKKSDWLKLFGKTQKTKTTQFHLLMILIFIVILPTVIIYSALPKSSGIKLAILLQSEIPATLLVGYFLFREQIKLKNIISISFAALAILILLYPNNQQINWADLTIALATISFPIGNHYSKLILNNLSPTSITCFRSLFGGIILLGISYLFEAEQISNFNWFSWENWSLILFSGILIYAISKLLWYNGLKRITIPRAASWFVLEPGIAILVIYLFTNSYPDTNQWIGLGLITMSLFVNALPSKAKPVLNLD